MSWKAGILVVVMAVSMSSTTALADLGLQGLGLLSQAQTNYLDREIAQMKSRDNRLLVGGIIFTGIAVCGTMIYLNKQNNKK